MEFVQNTFVTLFDGSPEKALRAVLMVMGLYVLTAAPLVAWVGYGLFQKNPTVPFACKDRERTGLMLQLISAFASLAAFQVKQQLQPKPEAPPQDNASDQAMKLIKSRRSVFPKDYTGKLVSRSVLEQMLEAANWAPTHGRTEPWRFVVLSPDGLQEMISITDKVMKSTFDESQYAKKKAKLESKAALYPRATFIAICSLRQANPEKVQPEWEEMAATSCAVQNLWLMGHALGVAGYWSSWQGESVCNSKDMKQFLGIGTQDSCLGFYLVGNSDSISSYRSKRGDMSDKVAWK